MTNMKNVLNIYQLNKTRAGNQRRSFHDKYSQHHIQCTEKVSLLIGEEHSLELDDKYE